MNNSNRNNTNIISNRVPQQTNILHSGNNNFHQQNNMSNMTNNNTGEFLHSSK